VRSALLTWATMSVCSPRGPTTPYQTGKATPGSTASAIVGTSGSTGSGPAFAQAANSAKVRAGTEGCTTNTKGNSAICAMAVKCAAGSKGTVRNSTGLIAIIAPSLISGV
jgi:hypothetical protein